MNEGKFKQFDWVSFGYGKIIVHCKTLEEIKDFKKQCGNPDVISRTGKEDVYYVERYDLYGERCIAEVNFDTYCCAKYCTGCCNISEWSDYMNKKQLSLFDYLDKRFGDKIRL